MSDMNGKSNTNNIIKARGTKDYLTWKPSSGSTASDYPAASCCNMYYTEGTKQGDWYLPSIGELCYIIPYVENIDTSIDKVGGIKFGTINTTGDLFLWSSSESTSSGNYVGHSVWRLNVWDCGFYSAKKTSTIFGCYAFISL